MQKQGLSKINKVHNHECKVSLANLNYALNGVQYKKKQKKKKKKKNKKKKKKPNKKKKKLKLKLKTKNKTRQKYFWIFKNFII